MTIPPPPPGRFDDDEPADNVTPVGKYRWSSGLLVNGYGKVKSLEFNLSQVLRLHPDWNGVVAFDLFAQKLVARRRPPFPGVPANVNAYPREWTDADTVATMQWLQGTKRVLIDATRSATDNALDSVGHAQAFHPVREYLAGLKWDGVMRLTLLFSRYFGAAENEYTAEAARCWMISAVARAMRSGCQADYMPVLDGQQGIGKSTGLRTLFSPPGTDWFSSSPLAIGSDEALKKLGGKWCIEIAELESFRGKAWTAVKQFITDMVDNFRDSYGRRAKDRPRQCVFAGTTNDAEYLGDRTGNRRFWPITCTRVDTAGLAKDRDQLWAEAYARFQSGEKWHMVDETLARDEQRKREIREPWFDIVKNWAATPAISDRTEYSHPPSDIEKHGITQAEVMAGALNLAPRDMTTAAQMRLGWILQKLGFERRRVMAAGARSYRYFRP